MENWDCREEGGEYGEVGDAVSTQERERLVVIDRGMCVEEEGGEADGRDSVRWKR